VTSNARTDDPQQRILDGICQFKQRHNYAPTIAEICQIVGLRSKSAVAAHLHTLRRLRLVTWEPGQERTLVVTDDGWVAREVVKAFLDDRGTPGARWGRRRRLMRDVIRIPEVRAAIDALLASRGVTLNDAVGLFVAHIRGTAKTVQHRNGKLEIVQSTPSQQLRALQDRALCEVAPLRQCFTNPSGPQRGRERDI